jgi:two-component system nitrate/nitrite response regulator NarL
VDTNHPSETHRDIELPCGRRRRPLQLRQKNPRASRGSRDPSGADVERPRVVIGDDNASTRTGVRLALENDGFVVCAEERTGPDAVSAALHDPPDVCLLEVGLPGGGIEAAGAIHSKLPQTKVVMLSASGGDDDLFAALEVGASGYLLKEMNPARLGPTLHDVLAGRAALPRALTARLIEEFRARARRGDAVLVRRSEKDLTSREWEVVDCLRDELSTTEIADRLFISTITVRRHIGSILKKLEVPTREAAVRAIVRRSRNLNAE